MRATLRTAGEDLHIESSLPWVARCIEEGSAGELGDGGAADASILVHVESEARAFDTRGWDFLTRGAWRRDGEVVIENACTSGFDVRVECSRLRAEFTYRWRPPRRERVAARVLRSRFHLLARAVLIQYPALWWAGMRGRAPLHVSACAVPAGTPLLSGASGVGRSTLVVEQLRRGGLVTGDNLAVADGMTVWGLVEPLRIEGGDGRRMPHGRRESPLVERADALRPDRIILLERGRSDAPVLRRCDAERAARSLIESTYMAGELRRFWDFAAILAAGTGLGPPHPPVTDVARAFAAGLPSFSLALGPASGALLSDLLDPLEMAA